MSDLKVVDQIDNWFDVLVVLADSKGSLSPAAKTLVSEFAERRCVYIVQPDQDDGPCRSDRSGPGVLWTVHGPRSDGPEQAERIWRFLRDTRVRRPLIWVEGPGYEHFLDRTQDDFKVFHLTYLDQVNSRVPGRCDLVVADSPEVGAALAGAEFSGSVACWAAPFDYAQIDREVCARVNVLLKADKNLNILVLYDDTFTHIKPIQEHLSAFSKHSRHRYFYFPVRADGQLFEPYKNDWPTSWNFDDYDAVVWHYCLRAAHEDNIDPSVVQQLAQYDGLKILFIQDDYDTTLTTWKWIEQVGIQLVMTCIPAYGIPYAFPDWKPGTVEFLQTLTGFVPEDDMDRFVVPMEDRLLHLAYRGRTLPYRYGSLGREKYLIGVRMKEMAAERGVPADIAVDDAGRIYGDDWYRFTASARATLGSETGSHVFDFDGSVAALSEQMQSEGVPYDDFFNEHLAELETHVRMNQVSPRIFEAVRLKTALVCFEGEYSGAILPDEHYIPLKKDFSNADEVFAKLENVELLKAMTERAYRDVIESDKWSHAAFIRRFDGIVESRLLRNARRELLTATIARRERDGSMSFVPRISSFEYVLETGVLRQPHARVVFGEMMSRRRQFEEASWDFKFEQTNLPPEDAEVVYRLGAGNVVPSEGSSVSIGQDGAYIIMSDEAWRSAAYAELPLENISFMDEHCWVRAKFADVSGDILFGAYNTDLGLLTDHPVPQTKGTVEVIIKVSAEQNAVMIRTGRDPSPAHCRFLSAEILRAPAYAPRVLEIARRLSAESSRLLWPEERSGPGSFQNPRPSFPPVDARVRYALRGDCGYFYAGGGSITVGEGGAYVTTMPNPWSYAAAVDLDLSSLSFDRDYHWIQVTVADVKDDVRVSLWCKPENRIVTEYILERQAEPQTAVFAMQGDASSVLIRKGAGHQAGSVIVKDIRIVSSPRYPKALFDLAEAYREDTPDDI